MEQYTLDPPPMRCSLLLCLVLLASLLPLRGAHAQVDTTVPTLHSFTFSPASVDVTTGSATVVAEARVTDDLAGVANVSFYLRRPDGSTPGWGSYRASGTALDGVWRANITIPQYAPGGTWTVYGLQVRDGVNNGRWIYTSELSTAGYPTELTVISTTAPDTAPPTLHELNFTPMSVDVSTGARAVTVRVRLQDVSGASYAYAYFQSPSGAQRRSGYLSRVSGTAQDGEYEGTVQIPQYSASGTWVMPYLYVVDTQSNYRYIYRNEITAAGHPTELDVTSTPSDATSPTLSLLTFSPSAVDISLSAATVNVRMRVRDDLVGVSSVCAYLRAPNGYTTGTCTPRTSGTALDGEYTGSITLPRYAYGGTWTVPYVVLRDALGNYRYTYTAELNAAGFPTELEVCNQCPRNDAPVITAVSIPSSASEGDVLSYSATATDADGDVLAYSWNFGDGSPSAAGQNATHRYEDNGTYQVLLRVDDGGGGIEFAYQDVAVANVAPSISALAGVPAAPVSVGTSVTLGASFTDAGALDTHTGAFTLSAPGVSPLSGGVVSGSGGSGTINGTFTFTVPGEYVVSVSVQDDDGSSSTYSETPTITVLVPDTDGDGLVDTDDNCPALANAAQTNTDGDALGDACDGDDDNDGWADGDDNAQFVANPDQADLDLDGIGDVIDDDIDGDDVPNEQDNAPYIPNWDQKDNDGDGTGDVADPDDDNDGVLDVDGLGQPLDNCPFAANPDQADHEGDGIGDVCDSDDDDDGVADSVDNAPLVHNPDQLDTDGDGAGDVIDTDDDGDGVDDIADNCPLASNSGQTDTDGDGDGNACDTDDDNDGVLDGVDNAPLQPNPGQEDLDGDGTGDVADADVEGDGVANDVDNCPLVVNADQANADGDGEGNACDADDDNDGEPDVTTPSRSTRASRRTTTATGPATTPTRTTTTTGRATPTSSPAARIRSIKAGASPDLDADFTPDCVDPDVDGDGIPNAEDAFPRDASESVDTDGDGTGDVADSDDDGDGQSDADEAACGSEPLDGDSRSSDNDGDGSPDCVDADDDGDGVADVDGQNQPLDNCPRLERRPG